MRTILAVAITLPLVASLALAQTAPTGRTLPRNPTLPTHPTRPIALCRSTEFETCSSVNQRTGVSVNVPNSASSNSKVGAAFNIEQAKSVIEGRGYTNVSELEQDIRGNWRGKGDKDGRTVPVTLDFKGNVNSPNEVQRRRGRTSARAFTIDQAKARVEAEGYSNVTGLKRDGAGNWRGKAVKNGKVLAFTLPFNGSVTVSK